MSLAESNDNLLLVFYDRGVLDFNFQNPAGANLAGITSSNPARLGQPGAGFRIYSLIQVM